MAGDLSSTFPIESTVPLHYRIDDGGLVGDALARCDDLLSSVGEADENEAGTKLLSLYQSFDERKRTAFFDGLITRFGVDSSAVSLGDLFLRLNAAPGAIASLVRMREHLQHHKNWAPIARDLTDVLRLRFHRGVLNFQQIDVETPSPLLERLIESEAVHPINDRREMARRLQADRRCYAFFHPAWPQEPLIFTEVALTRGIASKIQPI